MPGFDGTGPRGDGPMTGRGEGHCAIRLPSGGAGVFGYAGLQGSPVLGDETTGSVTRAAYPVRGTSQPEWPARAFESWSRGRRRWGRGR